MRPNVLSQALKSLTENYRFLVSLLLAAMTSTSFAVDYSAGGAISADTSRNDNIRLAERDKIQVTRYHAAPSLNLEAATETSTIQLNSTFDFNRYDKSEFNSDDQNIALTLAHQMENSSVGLNATLIRNSTITSELLTSGVVGNKAERTELYRVGPNWTYTFNETNLLQLSGSYDIQDYHSDAYTGYKNIGSELDWIHIVSERMKLIIAATYSDYHSDDVKFDVPGANTPLTDPTNNNAPILKGYFGQQSYSTRTKDKGAQIGIDYQWSESSLIQARIGRSNSTTSYPLKSEQDFCSTAIYQGLLAIGYPVGGFCDIPSSNDRLSTAQLNWKWSSEVQKFSLNTTKSTQPSANGYTVDALLISSNWSYQLTEVDQISADLTLTRNRAINKKSSIQNTSIADRDYRTATLAYSRQLNESWFVNASYQFSQQQYNDIDYRANGKTVSIGVRYQPQAWHWSR